MFNTSVAETSFVPVVSIASVLDGIAPLPIWFLKTDMQGFDYSCLKAGGQQLASAVRASEAADSRVKSNQAAVITRDEG